MAEFCVKVFESVVMYFFIRLRWDDSGSCLGQVIGKSHIRITNLTNGGRVMEIII